MNRAEQMAEADRRRAILAGLYVSPGYRLPERTLRAQVEVIGYTVSLDRLRTDLAWLQEQGLIDIEETTATLTERGADVVLGRSLTPGVKRPEPGEV